MRRPMRPTPSSLHTCPTSPAGTDAGLGLDVMVLMLDSISAARFARGLHHARVGLNEQAN